MRNEVKINRKTGEVYLFSQTSREQRAIMIRNIEGIVSFPIKVEELNGNKDAIAVHALYYQDSLIGEDVRLLTFDERDDAISARKELESAYRKHNSASKIISVGIPIIMIICAFFAGKYVPSNDSITLSGVKYGQQGYASTPVAPAMGDENIDAEALEKLAKKYEQQLAKKNQPIQRENIPAKNNENNALLSSKEEATLSGNEDSQKMMEMLNGQNNTAEQSKSQSQ